MEPLENVPNIEILLCVSKLGPITPVKRIHLAIFISRYAECLAESRAEDAVECATECAASFRFSSDWFNARNTERYAFTDL